MEEIENKIKALLDKVRPAIQVHGGDVHLIKVENSTATLKMEGACVHCSLAQMTYNGSIRPLVLQEVPEITEVLFE
jgi:Fe-S cluster biogenesis protein NfuA